MNVAAYLPFLQNTDDMYIGKKYLYQNQKQITVTKLVINLQNLRI